MRFAFFGYDFSIDLAQTLVAEGHELLAIFTFPCDQMFAYNLQAYAFADAHNIPITDKPVNAEHITALLSIGCEAFLVAGYPRKVPPIEGAYGLNIHPAYLPKARGITPGPFIILNEQDAGGFTIHKLAPEYDSGDILYQERIEINDTIDVETYSCRVALKSRAVITDIFSRLPEYWANAKPQDHSKATLLPPVTEEMRTLDWNKSSKELINTSRAFGRYGVIAHIQNNEGEVQHLGVFSFTSWPEKHQHPTGTLLRSSPREIVIAISDGYALLKEFQVIERVV